MTSAFDAIIVGAGQAGPPLAARLSEAGMKVALIERHLLGGTCVNTGCTPTKTMVASARTAFVARRAAEYGVNIGGDVRVDFAAVQARQRAVSTASRKGLEDWVAGMARCTLFRGYALCCAVRDRGRRRNPPVRPDLSECRRAGGRS